MAKPREATLGYVKENNEKKLFLKWILDFQSLSKIIKNSFKKSTRKTLSKKFKKFWDNPPKIEVPESNGRVFIVDTKYIEGRKYTVHICSTEKKPIFWSFYKGENYDSWDNFISRIPSPKFVVSDGHGGILRAVRRYWPDTVVQRCVFHVIKHCRNKLTNRPKYQAGVDLKKLILKDLIKVNSLKEKEKWIYDFRKWEEKYKVFLKEKSYSLEKTKSGRHKWWYKHKNLRGLKSHINNALTCLFSYLEYPEIPKTTNFLEGGINKTINELLSRHRGISLKQKASLITYFLNKKKKEKD